jgi:two-component system chemotaxis response regulator CheY
VLRNTDVIELWKESENLMKRVLIVDDASFMRMAIKIILQKSGFEVIGEAENGVVGIKKYQELQPDLVTMDITMPEMTGIEALKEITKFDPKAKVVMVSAMGQQAMVREAIVNGAKSFIVKPFKEDHVVETLNKILEM